MANELETKLKTLKSIVADLGLKGLRVEWLEKDYDMPHVEYSQKDQSYIVYLPKEFYVAEGIQELGRIYLGIKAHPIFIAASSVNRTNFDNRYEGENIRALNYTNDLFVAFFLVRRYPEYVTSATSLALSKLYALWNGHSMYPRVLNEQDFRKFLNVYVALLTREVYSDAVYNILEILAEPTLDNIKKLALGLFDIEVDYGDTLKICRRRQVAKTIELDGIYVR
jgi:hypothetical protein